MRRGLRVMPIVVGAGLKPLWILTERKCFLSLILAGVLFGTALAKPSKMVPKYWSSFGQGYKDDTPFNRRYDCWFASHERFVRCADSVTRSAELLQGIGGYTGLKIQNELYQQLNDCADDLTKDNKRCSDQCMDAAGPGTPSYLCHL